MTKRRKALNVVNETIVLSDSENEEVQLDNDDIQVIDVAEASQTIIDPTEEKTVPCPIDSVDPSVTIAKPDPLVVAQPADEPTTKEPVVINIDDEPDPDDDDDGIEVVGIVLAGRRTSRIKEKRASLNRRSSGSNSSLAMGLVSKAKNVLRRSASNSSSNKGLGHQQNYNLNKISSKSRKIGRNNKWKNKFQTRDVNFRGRPRNALTHNRSREYNRQVIFRPDNSKAPAYIPLDPGNFSFETNPFAPCSTSTPAFNRHAERTAWMQKKRNRPVPIAPGSNIMNAGETIRRAPGTLRPVVIDGSNIAVG